MPVTAEIRFGNGSVHRCIGRVAGGKAAPFLGLEDVQAHISRVNERNPDALCLVAIHPAIATEAGTAKTMEIGLVHEGAGRQASPAPSSSQDNHHGKR